MKKSLFIILLILISSSAFAEQPCTHLAQESLESLVTCISHTKASTPYMTAHNQQVFNHLAQSSHAAPHPYPSIGNMAYASTMYLMEGKLFGYHNPYVLFPYSYYMMQNFMR